MRHRGAPRTSHRIGKPKGRSHYQRRGDDRSVKIRSLEAAKIMKIKWLVLGCIEANLCNQILVRKLLTRSISFAFLCTSPISTIQQIFVTNFGDFFTNFQTTSSKICNFYADLYFTKFYRNLNFRFSRKFFHIPEI